MSKTRFNLSLESGIHKLLNTLPGAWKGETFSWQEPEHAVEKSTITATIRTFADGRFLLYEYDGSSFGEPITGAMILGYDLTRKIFQSIWLDSFYTDTGMIISNGNIENNLFSAQGRSVAPDLYAPWQWQTEINVIDYSTLVITHFTISPEGDQHKIMESRLERQ